MRRAHRLWHRRVWACLAVLLPLVLVLALTLRQNGPMEAAPEKLPDAAGAAGR